MRASGPIALSLCLLAGTALAEDQPPSASSTTNSVCLLIESAAVANNLPLEFFARLIWQESNFRPYAVGPVTRSGQRAQGIAQFMPGTASERGLLNPFDPVQALPKSAEFLRALLGEFGNLGLAAAAYNAGPKRVRDWLAGRATLPLETQRYVEAITGRAAADWVAPVEDKAAPAQPTCNEMIAMLQQKPTAFVTQLQAHVGQSTASPWGVQVSAGFSRERVLQSYAMIERRHRDSLTGFDPVILQSTLRSRGTRPFYLVRIGAATRVGADRLCARLRKLGTACMVLRNGAPGLRSG